MSDNSKGKRITIKDGSLSVQTTTNSYATADNKIKFEPPKNEIRGVLSDNRELVASIKGIIDNNYVITNIYIGGETYQIRDRDGKEESSFLVPRDDLETFRSNMESLINKDFGWKDLPFIGKFLGKYSESITDKVTLERVANERASIQNKKIQAAAKKEAATLKKPSKLTVTAQETLAFVPGRSPQNNSSKTLSS